MKKGLSIKCAVLALIAIIGISEPLACFATDDISQKKEQTKQKINEAEEKKAQAQQAADEAADDAAEAKSELDEATAALVDLYSEIDNTTALIDDTNATIEDLELQISEAETNRDAQYELLKSRIAFNYETTYGQNLITAFLEAGSFADFIDRIDYMMAVAEYDKKVISDYEAAIETVSAKKSKLSDTKDELAGYKADLAASEDELDALVGEKSADYAARAGELDDAESLVDDYDAEIEELQNQMASLEAAQAQAQAAMAQQIAAQQEAMAQQIAAQQSEETGETVTPEQVTLPREDTSGAVSASEYDVILLAATIQAEAGNQPYEGKLAVGSVIMNRVKSSSFPNTIYGVISQPKQFEPWPNPITDIMNIGPNSTCIEVARSVIGGARNGDWLFFMTKEWADKFGITGYYIIKDHVFFRKWGAN